MKHLADFAAQVAAMTEAQRAELAARFPIVTIERHALSVRNNILCAMQTPAPLTIVGGFRQWLNAGRCVRKGEKALYILCPMTRKAGEGDKADTEGNVTFFREVPIFDVAQTDATPATH